MSCCLSVYLLNHVRADIIASVWLKIPNDCQIMQTTQGIRNGNASPPEVRMFHLSSAER